MIGGIWVIFRFSIKIDSNVGLILILQVSHNALTPLFLVPNQDSQ